MKGNREIDLLQTGGRPRHERRRKGRGGSRGKHEKEVRCAVYMYQVRTVEQLLASKNQ